MKRIIIIYALLVFVLMVHAQYPRNQTIQAAEYFFSTDPGSGNGIPISIVTGQSDITINLTDLNVSLGENIYIRFKSSNGFWSSPRSIRRDVYFPNRGAAIAQGEYFINNDPGLGNAIPITFASGVAFLGDLNLHQGDKVYFRIRDSFIRWSPARCISYHFEDMRQATYRIKLASTGNYTNPSNLVVIPSPDSTCGYSILENAISWHDNDSIFIQYQGYNGFLSNWRRGVVAKACNDQTICSGNFATLTATGGSSYQWSNGMSGSSITINPLVTTIFGVMVTDGMGASSIDSVTIFVNPSPEIPVITVEHDSILTSNVQTGNQWYLNNAPIYGATQQNFTAKISGSYFVRVTNQYNCYSESATQIVIFQSSKENTLEGMLAIFPNPTDGLVQIKSDHLLAGSYQVFLYDNLGKAVLTTVVILLGIAENIRLDIGSLPNGLYLLRIANSGKNWTTKISKSKM